MSSRSMASAKASDGHPHAVLPPPPSHPDDGPDALSVPPLDRPPTSLVSAGGRVKEPVSVGTWATMAVLFLLGTVVSFVLASR